MKNKVCLLTHLIFHIATGITHNNYPILMKKFTLVLFCFIGIAIIGGCKKEVKPDESETPVTLDNTKPSLSIINQEGYIANGDILLCGINYNFGFIARSNSQTNAELSSLTIKVDNEEKANLDLNGTEYIYNDNITFNNDYPNERINITAILTDKAGKQVSKSLQVYLQKSNNLEGEPSISVMAGDYYITGTADNPTVIDVDNEDYINYRYGFHVESNAETMKELKNMVIILDVTYYIDGVETEVYYDTIDLTGKTFYDFSEYLFGEKEIATLIDGTITAVVTDVDNQSNSASVAFTIQMEEEPLPIERIEWKREGTNVVDEEEMAYYGLRWTGSYKEVFATIEPLNEDVIMYLCDGNDFDEITNWSNKYAFFTNLTETATPIEKYRNVSTWQSGDYTDMLAVIYGEDLYLINITHADVERITNSAGQTIRLDITISGEAK